MGEVDISTEEKARARIEGFFSFYSCSFYLKYGFGLSPFAFDRSNAMLALSDVFKFSAKEITPLLSRFFCGNFLKKVSVVGGTPTTTFLKTFARFLKKASAKTFGLILNKSLRKTFKL